VYGGKIVHIATISRDYRQKDYRHLLLDVETGKTLTYPSIGSIISVSPDFTRALLKGREGSFLSDLTWEHQLPMLGSFPVTDPTWECTDCSDDWTRFVLRKHDAIRFWSVAQEDTRALSKPANRQ
jgi:hypothetical protein